MGKQTAINVSKQIKEAIENVLKANNLILASDRGHYTPNGMDITLKFTEVSQGETPESVLIAQFKKGCLKYGLPAEWYGKKFLNGRKKFQIVAIHEGRITEYPVHCKDLATGRITRYKSATIFNYHALGLLK